MKRFLLLSFACWGIVTFGTAFAVTWNTYNDGSNNGVGASFWQGNSSQLTFWSGPGGGSFGDPLVVSAYRVTDSTGSGSMVAAPLAIFDHGLGVNEGSSPQHAVDNNGGVDLLVFQFDDAHYNPTAFMIGWKQTDADAEVWLGGNSLGAGFDFVGKCLSGCTDAANNLDNLGFTSLTANYDNLDVGPAGRPFLTTLTGQYLVIAAKPGDTNDYFKLQGIVGVAVVPEPGTLTLFAALIVSILGLGRRRMWVGARNGR